MDDPAKATPTRQRAVRKRPPYEPTADDVRFFGYLAEARLATVLHAVLVYSDIPRAGDLAWPSESAIGDRLKRLRGPDPAEDAVDAARLAAGQRARPTRSAVAYLEAGEVQIARGGRPLVYAVKQAACNLVEGKPEAPHPLAELRLTPELLDHPLAVAWFAATWLKAWPAMLRTGVQIAWDGESRSEVTLRAGAAGKRRYYLAPDGVLRLTWSETATGPAGDLALFVEVDRSDGKSQEYWDAKFKRYSDYYSLRRDEWERRYGRWPGRILVTVRRPDDCEAVATRIAAALRTLAGAPLDVWVAPQRWVALDPDEIIELAAGSGQTGRVTLPDPRPRVNAPAWRQVRVQADGAALYAEPWRLADLLSDPAGVPAVVERNRLRQEKEIRDQAEREAADRRRIADQAAAEARRKAQEEADRKEAAKRAAQEKTAEDKRRQEERDRAEESRRRQREYDREQAANLAQWRAQEAAKEAHRRSFAGRMEALGIWWQHLRPDERRAWGCGMVLLGGPILWLIAWYLLDLGLLGPTLADKLIEHQYDAIQIAGWLGALAQSAQGWLIISTVIGVGVSLSAWGSTRSY